MTFYPSDVRRIAVLAASFSLFLSSASPCGARLIPHPGGFISLQAAVNASAPGDTVLVGMGRYVENVVLKAGVSLRSSSGPDSTILVSPGGAERLTFERLVHCPAGVDSTTTIEGFTLEDGGFSGMGIYCEDSSPVIRGNVLRGFGWGINMRNSNSLIEDNLIEACKTFPVTILASTPRLYRNEIRNNGAAAIDVSGRKAKPVIGGSRERANRIYGNPKALRNGSRNDIDATWNDWGWETTEEMNEKGYPADIIAIVDGNDFSKSHRGRGKVDYSHWIQADAASVAKSPGAGTTVAGATSSADSTSTPTAAVSRGIPPAVPIGAAVVLVAIFLGVARRRSSGSPQGK